MGWDFIQAKKQNSGIKWSSTTTTNGVKVVCSHTNTHTHVYENYNYELFEYLLVIWKKNFL